MAVNQQRVGFWMRTMVTCHLSLRMGIKLQTKKRMNNKKVMMSNLVRHLTWLQRSRRKTSIQMTCSHWRKYFKWTLPWSITRFQIWQSNNKNHMTQTQYRRIILRTSPLNLSALVYALKWAKSVKHWARQAVNIGTLFMSNVPGRNACVAPLSAKRNDTIPEVSRQSTAHNPHSKIYRQNNLVNSS